jgi:hypothetical protein
VRILACVSNQHRLARLQHPLARGIGARLIRRLEPESRLEPEPVEVHPANVAIVRVAQNRRELNQLV